MPTVTATVIPGTGSDPTQVSGDPQQKGTGKDEPSGSSPTVPPSVANPTWNSLALPIPVTL